MRCKQAQFQSTENNTLQFFGTKHEKLEIEFLKTNIVRVCLRPYGNYRMQKTYMIRNKNETLVTRTGLNREKIANNFDTVEWHQVENLYSIGKDATWQVRLAQNEQGHVHLTWYHKSKAFAADLPSRGMQYDTAGTSVLHYMKKMYAQERYYGFGEKSGLLVKNGKRMKMKNVDSFAYNAETSDPLYKHFPFYITVVPELNIAYGLLYDNLSTCEFDMGCEIDAYHGTYRYYQAENGDLDYYMIFGPTVQQVVQNYLQLTGMPLLPPKWALGYLGSTMTYTEAPDAQEQLKKFVQLCKQHDIPCDMFHLSSGYSTGPLDGKRYVFTWNNNKVPDPKQMIDTFHQSGIKVGANVKPWLLCSHPYFESAKLQDIFVRDAENSGPELVPLWSAGIYQSANGAYIDFLSENGFNWWKEHAKKHLLEYGVDVLWNDNNEFEIWDSAALCDKTIPIAHARPVQTLLMNLASFEAQKEQFPNRRPFVLTRSACPGIQTMAQTWTGDNVSNWHTLKYNIPMGLGASISGMIHTGHDAGGFAGEMPDPELFVRWIQHAIFLPRFCVHSCHSDGSVNELWMYPEVLPLIKQAVELRYCLIPYIYTLSYLASVNGTPIMQPLVYKYQDDAKCLDESFQYLFGNIFVAPIVEANQQTMNIYLPGNIPWVDFYNPTKCDLLGQITVPVTLNNIPLFVPCGTIIPMYYNDANHWHVYGNAQCDTFTCDVYMDDGISNEFITNQQFAHFACKIEKQSDSFVCNITRIAGKMVIPTTTVTLHLPPSVTICNAISTGNCQYQILLEQ